jgi:cell division protein FtsB
VSRRVLGGALAGVLALGFVLYGSSGVVRVWQMKQEVEALEREIVDLRALMEELTREVDRFRTDPAAIERLAREELGWVRKGEKVLKFPTAPGAR